MIEYKNISAGTVTRTIFLVLALINQFLSLKGISPIPVDNDALEQFISFAFLGITAVWGWWKNNSFTLAARQADSEMHRLRSIKK